MISDRQFMHMLICRQFYHYFVTIFFTKFRFIYRCQQMFRSYDISNHAFIKIQLSLVKTQVFLSLRASQLEYSLDIFITFIIVIFRDEQ